MMPMELLELDFHATRRSSPWMGRVLLAVAVAFAIDVTSAYVHVREGINASQAELARLGRPLKSMGTRGVVQRVSPGEMRVARDTIDRLSLQWDNLFTALESNPDEDIALLSIQPDARSGTALISGEGKDYASVLHYTAKLAAAKTLRDVYLVRHEMRPADEWRRPLAFAVSAAWKGKR